MITKASKSVSIIALCAGYGFLSACLQETVETEAETSPIAESAEATASLETEAPAESAGISNARVPGTNPITTAQFTADPAAMVHDGTVWLYVGHDDPAPDQRYGMPEWLAFSSADMKNWEAHGPIMKPTDFSWAIADAWASEVEPHDGRFWFYTTVTHDDTHPGKAIGVAVSDIPEGPFVDARGSALITAEMTPKGEHNWEDIDPTVFIDDDGTPYLLWGNVNCYMVELAPNMTELAGEIQEVDLPYFTEGPWVHKRGDWYYLSYAAIDNAESDDEQIHYAMSKSVRGPWEHMGQLAAPTGSSFTIHPSIIEFEDQWYFFYHDGSLSVDGEEGGEGRRNVRVDYLYYNEDGTIKPIIQTAEGVSVPPVR
ncbi:family 43 glycosylhydrolase [Parvularcula flava]|uniref:Family 43 glycosylhydrolase n=1 Tax=Aquisalinus luteolus TaxID=1566827 RepID=A0A8J3A4Y0_9PROT|nr:glycoside hydrolase family 43 protein [Aquisalinus luteolus]NHK28789.1 family 43 glycosylhydrolase [Aquisalinus luteolus]GGH99522.1 glycoside hydrolase [Aquisalinus luteolus]